MPRPPPTTTTTLPQPIRHLPFFLPILAFGIGLVLLLLSLVFYLRLRRKRTVPRDLKPPFPISHHRFSFSALRRATDSFSASKRLGQGGFGSVYRGILDSGQEIAVKLMTEGSVQGEREFHNELSLASSIHTLFCPQIVCLLGSATVQGKKDFRSLRRNNRVGRRIALVYEYMHNGSLQNSLFERRCPELRNWNKRFAIITSVAKGLYFLHNCRNPPIIHGDIKPSNILLDCNFEAKIADFGLAQVMGGSEEMVDAKNTISEAKWKLENVDTEERVKAKEWAKEEIESEESEERRRKELVKCASLNGNASQHDQRKKKKKELERWASLDRQVTTARNSKKPREWWKEEFCDELSRKKKRVCLMEDEEDSSRPKQHENGAEERKQRSWSRGRRSLDQWLEKMSFGRRNSEDESSDKKNECIATSTRGTVCYIAPEFGCGGQATDKCDVYSFGVLVLVVVSGRRPLQVTTGGMCELDRGNLISWAKQLASNGKLLNLVDPEMEILKREEAVLCVTIALVCLQRSPEKRPTMKEIVEMLCGNSEPPQLPFEFSPSPPPFTPPVRQHNHNPR